MQMPFNSNYVSQVISIKLTIVGFKFFIVNMPSLIQLLKKRVSNLNLMNLLHQINCFLIELLKSSYCITLELLYIKKNTLEQYLVRTEEFISIMETFLDLHS